MAKQKMFSRLSSCAVLLLAMMEVAQGFITTTPAARTAQLTTREAAKLTDLSPLPGQTPATFTDKLFFRNFLPPHVYRDTVRYEVKKDQVRKCR